MFYLKEVTVMIFKKQHFCLLLLYLVSIPLYSSTSKPSAIGLGDIFRIIQEKNPQILSSRENVDQATHELQIQESPLWPNLDASLSQAKTKTGSAEADSYSGKFTASMPIFDLQKIANYQLADLALNRAELGHDAFLQVILREGAYAFFNHLRNIKQLTFIDTNLKRDETLLELARTQFEAGTATSIDVTRAESVLASRQRQQLQQLISLRSSELNLKRILDLPEDYPLQLNDTTFDRDISDIQPLYEQALPLNTILRMRTDYLAAERDLHTSQKELDKAGWESVPIVSLSGEAGTFANRPLSGRDRSLMSVTATVTMPIFEGFRIQSNKRKARSNVREQEYKLRDFRNRIEAEYSQSLFDNKARYEQILLALKQIELAEQELSLAQNRFEQGISDNQEVVNAQANLATAQSTWVDVVFQYNQSRIQLAFVKGDVRTVNGQYD